jgi:hypothetical protein
VAFPMPLAIHYVTTSYLSSPSYRKFAVSDRLREWLVKSTRKARVVGRQFSVGRAGARFRTLTTHVPTAIKLAYLQHFVIFGPVSGWRRPPETNCSREPLLSDEIRP